MGVLRAFECLPDSIASQQLGLPKGVPDVVHGVGFGGYHATLSPSLLYSAEQEGRLVVSSQLV